MGKTYKVHKYFDVDDMTTEEPCRCYSPESGFTIFDRLHNSTESELTLLNSYNSTGTVFSAEDVDWTQLKKSECEL